MNFRRCITALAVLAVFAGLASAQVNVGSAQAGPLACNATVAVPPQLRAEGLTELIGDIVITCTGGSATAVGAAIPTANITVSLGTNVTSRLLGTASVTNASEALLLIDEPGSSVGGAGTAIGQTVCGNPAVGCSLTVPASGPVLTNVFQGVVNANQVTFFGIPILAPVSSGSGRVFRITNVRANVSGLGTGPNGTVQMLASVSISGSTSLPVSNPVLIAGFIQPGLSASVVGAGGGGSILSLAQCGGGNSPSNLGVVRFNEGFGTSFKTRVFPISTDQYSGQRGVNVLQNIPGNIYNSESGFITPAVPGAGLADFSTRLKATFNNVPNTVRIFVTTTNIINGNSITTPPAGNAAGPFAQLVTSETIADSNGVIPLASSTTSVNTGAVLLAEIPVVNGTATAVWEVVNVNPSGQDSLAFGFYQQFSAQPGTNTPPPGTGTVNLSFAPTYASGNAFQARSDFPIPRFVDISSGANAFSISLCQTALLFPYVVNAGGFDTGVAISNTTTDPFGTRAQNGTCTLNWYGSSAPTKAFTTPSIGTGTTWAGSVSDPALAPGFFGYMIAVCNFQLAHGFAFVSDVGSRNLAMGYLALVLPDTTGNRNSRTEQLNN